MFTPNNPNTNLDPKHFRLVKAAFIEQPSQQDQYYRPFVTVYDDNIRNALYQDIDLATKHKTETVDYRENDMGKGMADVVAASSMRSSSNMLLQPSITAAGQLAVPNGWRERRFAFFLEIDVMMGMVPHTEQITGFTDYAGYASVSGALDPNMKMMFSSHQAVRKTAIAANNNSCAISTLESTQILAPQSLQGIQAVDANACLLTPHAVVSNISLLETQAQSGFGAINDDRSNLTKAKTIARNAAIPANFVSSIVNAASRNAATMDVIGDDDYYAAYSYGGDHAIAPQIAEEISHAATITNEKVFDLLDQFFGSRFNNGVTVGQFQSIFPDVQGAQESPYKVAMLGSDADRHMFLDAETLNTNRLEVQIGTSLSHSIPHLMTNMKMSVFHTTFTVKPGNFFYSPISVPQFQFSNMDGQYTIDNICRGIFINAIEPIMRGKSDDYIITIDASSMYNITITIALDGGFPVKHTFPLFCTGAVSPNLGANQSQLYAMSNDIKTILNDVQFGNQSTATPAFL